jgi:hypothetical protein
MMFGHAHCRHRKSRGINMDNMMESPLIKVLAFGALVYLGAKTIHHLTGD